MKQKSAKLSTLKQLYFFWTTPMRAVIKTTQGDINVILTPEKTPVTVTNFVVLAQAGFYDDISFHRVIEDFMVQAGCPHGTGTGGPGYTFQDEFHPELTHDRAGILSMANAWPGTNGSQFFITHTETPWLDGKHAVFGNVVSDEDQALINAITQGDKIHWVDIVDDTADLLEQMKEFVEMISGSLNTNI